MWNQTRLECTALDDASGFALDRLRTDLAQSRPARLATLVATSYHGGEEGCGEVFRLYRWRVAHRQTPVFPVPSRGRWLRRVIRCM
jgi:hypothetical protein